MERYDCGILNISKNLTFKLIPCCNVRSVEKFAHWTILDELL
jgi:hypothetical protein